MGELPIRRLQFFTIRTKDLPRARRFYVDLLGFPITSEKPDEYFQISIAGVPLCVDFAEEHGLQQPNQIGLEVTDLQAAKDFLRSRKISFQQASAPGSGEHWVSIKDPDGHELIFLQTG